MAVRTPANPHSLCLPFLGTIWPPFAETGFNSKDFFIPLISGKKLYRLNSCSHLLSFCVCASLASACELERGLRRTLGSAQVWREPDWPPMSVSSRQAFNSDTDSFKLAYGGHQYHASCANFWINCVEPKPPGLVLPDLL